MSRFLTFDLGTTLFKVALFDDAGHLLDLERSIPPINRSQARVELNTAELIETLVGAVRRLQLRSQRSFDDVAAVSFATQANSFTFLNRFGDPTIPLILWPDRRAESLAAELERIAALPDFRQSTGMPAFGPALALAKVYWFRRNAPRLLMDAEQFCLIGDILTLLLTNQRITEAGVAGLTGALNIRSLCWRDDVLALAGVPPIKMPQVRSAGTDLGPVSRNWGHTFGLRSGCRFVLGSLDQYAGAIGTGTVSPGQICETTGTVLAAVRCDDHLDPDRAPGVFQGPGFSPERFFQMSFSSTSANLLEHYRNTLPDKPSFETLAREAADADREVRIEPFEEGKSLKKCFARVRPHHSRGQIVRGIMRCVAGALKKQVDSIAGGVLPVEIRAAGGGARSDLWLQMKADLLRIPFVALECEEPTSLGAAILAAHGIGMGSIEEIAGRWVRVRKRFTPGDALRS